MLPHWSCEESPLQGRDGVFSLCWETGGPERSCGVSALWAHCFGPAGSTAALECVCVLHEPQNSRGGEEGGERSGCVSCVRY